MSGLFGKLGRLLLSPANWCGLTLAIAVLVLKALGLVGAAGLPLALAAYVAGLVVGGLWLGFPKLAEPAWDTLEFADQGDAREAMGRALHGVRALVQHNPDKRLPASLQAQALALCASLESLLAQWERSKGALSLHEGFHARHIAISYLPNALNTFLAIPPAYAGSRVLHNGKTAVESFRETLQALDRQVGQLAEDLASQDAEAFLAHSEFLQLRFGGDGEAAAAASTAAPAVASAAARAKPAAQPTSRP